MSETASTKHDAQVAALEVALIEALIAAIKDNRNGAATRLRKALGLS